MDKSSVNNKFPNCPVKRDSNSSSKCKNQQGIVLVEEKTTNRLNDVQHKTPHNFVDVLIIFLWGFILTRLLMQINK